MFNYQFESTPVDSEILLLEEPTDLLKDHIRDQFLNPLNMKFDYVGSFIENYKFSIMRMQNEDDEIAINQIYDDFISFMMNIMEKNLQIGYPDFDMRGIEDQLDMLHMSYRYFIINMKHNFSSFCMNYITKHREKLLEDLPKKKDIMTLNLQHDMIDSDDIRIITNLYDIIVQILEEDQDVDLFLHHSDINDQRLETDQMIEYYEKFWITGNFYENYSKMVLRDPSIIKEIESKLRNKILKPYRKLFKKVEVREKDDKEEK